jgi:hypothetical protein
MDDKSDVDDDIQDNHPGVNDYTPNYNFAGSTRFWVTDPSNHNKNGVTFLKTPTQFGFNELDRRRQDLCDLINQSCYYNPIYSISQIIVKGFETKPKM